jgi:hypothetical protein
LKNHLGCEGLFRKSGSSVRQRQLKVSSNAQHEFVGVNKQLLNKDVGYD